MNFQASSEALVPAAAGLRGLGAGGTLPAAAFPPALLPLPKPGLALLLALAPKFGFALAKGAALGCWKPWPPPINCWIGPSPNSWPGLANTAPG